MSLVFLGVGCDCTGAGLIDVFDCCNWWMLGCLSTLGGGMYYAYIPALRPILHFGGVFTMYFVWLSRFDREDWKIKYRNVEEQNGAGYTSRSA